MTHLWEIDHPYYCYDGNYYADYRDNHGLEEHASWQDFYDAMGEADQDWNFVVRWDWKRPDPDDYELGEEMPSETLHIYYVQQRKGNFWAHVVQVTEADELAVRAWLELQAKQMRNVWEPFLV